MLRRRSTRAGEPPFWLARLRWRIRGHSARIAFAAAIVAGVVILEVLPPWGSPGVSGRGIALLLGLVAALAVVGAATGARLLRRRDPSLPRIVARDRAAALAVGLGVLGLCVGGFVHRPAVVAAQQRYDGMVDAARRLAERRAPEFATQRLDDEDVLRLPAGVLRVCFPVGRPDRAWCAVVRRDRDVPRARTDSDSRPNAQLQDDAAEG